MDTFETYRAPGDAQRRYRAPDTSSRQLQFRRPARVVSCAFALSAGARRCRRRTVAAPPIRLTGTSDNYLPVVAGRDGCLGLVLVTGRHHVTPGI